VARSPGRRGRQPAIVHLLKLDLSGQPLAVHRPLDLEQRGLTVAGRPENGDPGRRHQPQILDLLCRSGVGQLLGHLGRRDRPHPLDVARVDRRHPRQVGRSAFAAALWQKVADRRVGFRQRDVEAEVVGEGVVEELPGLGVIDATGEAFGTGGPQLELGAGPARQVPAAELR